MTLTGPHLSDGKSSFYIVNQLIKYVLGFFLAIDYRAVTGDITEDPVNTSIHFRERGVESVFPSILVRRTAEGAHSLATSRERNGNLPQHVMA